VNTQADFSFTAGQISLDADCALSSQYGVKTGPDNENSAMIGVAVSMHNFPANLAKKMLPPRKNDETRFLNEYTGVTK
jgi:hypothetical protein